MDQMLICSICQDIFIDVVEAPCCHTCFCKECLAEWIGRAKTCPFCRVAIQSITLCKPNVPFQRLVNNTPAKCEHDGCTDSKLTRGILAEHMKNCGFAPIECELGKAACPGVRKNTLEAHKLVCPFRPKNCPLCNQILNPKEDHDSLCPKVEIPCPQGCGEKVQRAKMKQHLNSSCKLSFTPCPFAVHGCNAKLKKGDMKDHMKSNKTQHFDLLQDSYKKLSHEHKEQGKEMKLLKKENAQLKSAVQSLERLKPQLPHNPYHYLPVVLPCNFMVLEPHKRDWLIIEPLSCRTNRAAGSSLGQSFLFSGIGFNQDNNQVANPSYPVVIPADKVVPAYEYGAFNYYYFEITCSAQSGSDQVSLGFATGTHPWKGKLGENSPSWGFNIYDGTLTGFGVDKTSTKQDFLKLDRLGSRHTVGCLLIDGIVFYSVNGKFNEQPAFTGLPKKLLFPAVGLDGPSVSIHINFGKDPFSFTPGSKNLLSCIAKPACTFTISQNHQTQFVYNCRTCGLSGDYGICVVCAKQCHKGHDIKPQFFSNFYCDCGSPNTSPCVCRG